MDIHLNLFYFIKGMWIKCGNHNIYIYIYILSMEITTWIQCGNSAVDSTWKSSYVFKFHI